MIRTVRDRSFFVPLFSVSSPQMKTETCLFYQENSIPLSTSVAGYKMTMSFVLSPLPHALPTLPPGRSRVAHYAALLHRPMWWGAKACQPQEWSWKESPAPPRSSLSWHCSPSRQRDCSPVENPEPKASTKPGSYYEHTETMKYKMLTVVSW